MSAVPLITEVAINQIRAAPETQMRIKISESVVEDYADAINDGAPFPPIVVFHDGKIYWLADGFHRHAAHLKLGRETILADICKGGLRDAVGHSLSANGTHGLQRTRADKRRVVEAAVADAEWAKLSDRDIAKLCGVSHTLVAQVRKGGTLAIEKPRAVRMLGNLATPGIAYTAIPVEPPSGNIAAGNADDLVSIVRPMLTKASDDAIVDLICELERIAKKRGIR